MLAIAWGRRCGVNSARFVAGALAVLAALAGPTHATSPHTPLEIHYSPEERLDRIDADLIATATTSIDLASYSLTDPMVIDALDAAQRREVKIRIVLDPSDRRPGQPALAATQGRCGESLGAMEIAMRAATR